MIKHLSNNNGQHCYVTIVCKKVVIITEDETISVKAEFKKDEDGDFYYDIPVYWKGYLKELGFTNFEGQAGC